MDGGGTLSDDRKLASAEDPAGVRALRKFGLLGVPRLPEFLLSRVPPAEQHSDAAARTYLAARTYDVEGELGEILRMALAVGVDDWADPNVPQKTRRARFIASHPERYLTDPTIRNRRVPSALRRYLQLLDERMRDAEDALVSPTVRLITFDHTFRLRETVEVEEIWTFIALKPLGSVTRTVQWGASLARGEFRLEVVEGGRCGQVVASHSDTISFTIELGRELQPGQRGSVRVKQAFPLSTLRVPSTHFASIHPPDHLAVHLHVFDDPRSYKVWRRDGAPVADLPVDPTSFDSCIELDRFGQVSQYFEGMRPNHYYGISWEPRGRTEAGGPIPDRPIP